MVVNTQNDTMKRKYSAQRAQRGEQSMRMTEE